MTWMEPCPSNVQPQTVNEPAPATAPGFAFGAGATDYLGFKQKYSAPACMVVMALPTD